MRTELYFVGGSKQRYSKHVWEENGGEKKKQSCRGTRGEDTRNANLSLVAY